MFSSSGSRTGRLYSFIHQGYTVGVNGLPCTNLITTFWLFVFTAIRDCFKSLLLKFGDIFVNYYSKIIILERMVPKDYYLFTSNAEAENLLKSISYGTKIFSSVVASDSVLSVYVIVVLVY